MNFASGAPQGVGLNAQYSASSSDGDEQVTVFMTVTLARHERETLRHFESWVAQATCVVECHLISGQCDYLVKAVVNDDAEFNLFKTRLRAELPFVASCVPFSVARSVSCQAPNARFASLPTTCNE